MLLHRRLRTVTVTFLVRADYLSLEEHFINRHRIRINKGHLLFPEHQKFWKLIKISSQKVKKKYEIFSRFWKKSKIFGFSPEKSILKILKKRKFSIGNRIENRKFWIFDFRFSIGFSMKNVKIFRIFENFFDFRFFSKIKKFSTDFDDFFCKVL